MFVGSVAVWGAQLLVLFFFFLVSFAPVLGLSWGASSLTCGGFGGVPPLGCFVGVSLADCFVCSVLLYFFIYLCIYFAIKKSH